MKSKFSFTTSLALFYAIYDVLKQTNSEQGSIIFLPYSRKKGAQKFGPFLVILFLDISRCITDEVTILQYFLSPKAKMQFWDIKKILASTARIIFCKRNRKSSHVSLLWTNRVISINRSSCYKAGWYEMVLSLFVICWLHSDLQRLHHKTNLTQKKKGALPATLPLLVQSSSQLPSWFSLNVFFLNKQCNSNFSPVISQSFSCSHFTGEKRLFPMYLSFYFPH